MPSTEWKISSSLLQDLLAASKRSHPNEFIALLSTLEKNGRFVEEVVVIPAVSGRDYAALHSELVPFDPLIVGTVHSHPTPSPYPSPQDLMTFARMGDFHLILAFPYALSGVRAFNARGKRIPLRVV
ncbi:MAG: Mov34/MPN/PAD-1 family protein [Candidatus Iainarchaeum archaeon]|uniref:Mov34/MPN/PAD-1 family protein n=1 Tax=Candidatus Iainarchaeum sp. TaxID=3101447 RepID=A0A7T9DJT5_9ARCH|nr:MAG: Mov34/MPN/PAD-1 family protein [Candidatus Diapherotrites archaeon]